MSGSLQDEELAVLREQGFFVARQFVDAAQVQALRALSERHLHDHVAVSYTHLTLPTILLV